MKRKSVESLNAFFVLFLRQRGGTACRAVPRRERSGGARCGTDRCRRRCSDRAGGPVAVGYRSGAFHSGLKGRIPKRRRAGEKTSRTVCPACFESCAGCLFSGPAAGDGVGVRRICDGCSRTFSAYLFRYLSRYIFSSRGMTGLVMNPLHPASSAVRRSVSKA